MDFGSLYDAFQAMAKAGLSVEEVMEALEAELAETSPRSSVSRPRFQEYKPSLKCDMVDRGAPGTAPGSSVPLDRCADLPPKRDLTAQVKPERSSRGPARTHAIRR